MFRVSAAFPLAETCMIVSVAVPQNGFERKLKIFHFTGSSFSGTLRSRTFKTVKLSNLDSTPSAVFVSRTLLMVL